MSLSIRQRSFAWLQLLRLPNVFTAVADVMMGYLVTHGDLHPVAHFALLVVASCSLYLSGIVLNDVFDADVDARDRPERPIPSGRITLRAATAVGWAMLASGALVAWFASFVVSDWRPGIVATMLAACIALYDGVLKRTPIAPLAMGACRTLNILLGMSLALPDGLAASAASVKWGSAAAWLIPIGIGVYIVGVTIFARRDARISSRSQLTGGLIVLLAGIGLLAVVPIWTANRPPLVVVRNGWYLLWLWALLALITARRCVSAIWQPTPQRVQTAVRHCVQSIIVLDAAVCVGYAGTFWGFVVLALLFPALLLTLWLNAT